MQNELEGQLPLTEPTFFILLSLLPSQRHGYAIMKEVAALSGGRLSLGTGTLYGALKRLCEHAWIERVDDAEDDDQGRPRKAYRLTELGRRILEAEIGRLQTLVRAAELSSAGGAL